jgi:hypothetical protein
MSDLELLSWCIEEANKYGYITFTEEMYSSITPEQSNIIVNSLGTTTMMKLPEREIRFFEWLKENDYNVWFDLWGDSDIEPYIVGTSFLTFLLDKTKGFPICDLVNTDNYYFTSAHLVDKESAILIDSVKERFLANESLTFAQLLALEISLAPTDIWHFAYKHKIDLTKAKHAVEQLIEDKILIHLTKAEHLANFVDIKTVL